MREPQADRLVGIDRGQGIAHHRRRRIYAEHDGFAVEAADADIVGDLPAYLQHGGLAAAAAEERKHVDRPVDRPFDVLIDQRLEVLALALVDRGMQRARKTPETVLCHDGHLKTWEGTAGGPKSVRDDAEPNVLHFNI